MGDLVTTCKAPTGEGTSTCSLLSLGRLGLLVASLLICLASRLGEGDLSRVRDPSAWGVTLLGGEVCFTAFFFLFLEDSAKKEVSVDSISSWSESARRPSLPSVKL